MAIGDFLIFTLLISIGIVFFWWALYAKNNRDPFHPIIVFVVGFFIFYVAAHIYYRFFADVAIFQRSPQLRVLTLAWSLVAFWAYILGYGAFSRIELMQKLKIGTRKAFRLDWAKYLILLGICFALLAAKLYFKTFDYFIYYLTHQNNTIELTAGKMYLVWGILLIRTSLIFHLVTYLKRRQDRIKIQLWRRVLLISHFLMGFIFVFSIGSRLLLISYLIEVLVLIHYQWHRIRLLWLIVLTTTVFFFGVVGMGIWRNYGWESNKQQYSLGEFIKIEVTERLGSRLFNNYFDAVKNFAFALEYTDNGLPIQYGRTYLALLFQPIPRAYRPEIRLAMDPRARIHCEVGGNEVCGIDPLLGELYQNFLWFGIPMGLLFLGGTSYLVYQVLIINGRRDMFAISIYGIFVYALLLWLRGAFIGHTSLILMDLVPLVLAGKLVFQKRE